MKPIDCKEGNCIYSAKCTGGYIPDCLGFTEFPTLEKRIEKVEEKISKLEKQVG